MDVKTESVDALETAKVRLLNTPNAQTQAAMRDADVWVAEMRAKKSQNIPLSVNTHFEIFTT